MPTFLAILDAALEIVTKYKDLIGILGVPAILAWAIKEYRGRVRIELRQFAFGGAAQGGVTSITFRAINTSEKLVALCPSFTLDGITPEGRRHRYTFKFIPLPLATLDLKLPPHEERLFLASNEQLQNRVIFFLWFMEFRIPLTKGGPIYMRVKNANLRPMSWIRFRIERPIFWLRHLLARLCIPENRN